MKLLQKVLIGGMLLSSMLAFGDSFMNDFSNGRPASYGFATSEENLYNGVIDGTDAMTFNNNGKLAFLCNTRSNNPAFSDENGKIIQNLFESYLNSNYFNIIGTEIPYEEFEGGHLFIYGKTLFFRSHTTNEGERKIAILKKEASHIDIYSLIIKDQRDEGKQQKAVMEGKIAEIPSAGKPISFFDVIDFRAMATNKDTFKKIETLQTPYAVIGHNQQLSLINLEDSSITSSTKLYAESLRAGTLAIDKDGNFSYYVSGLTQEAMSHMPRLTIWKVSLAFENNQLVFKENQGFDHETSVSTINNFKPWDPLIRISTNKDDEVLFEIRSKHGKSFDKSMVKIGKMGSITEKKETLPFNTNYMEKDGALSYAKNFAQKNGYNIDMIIYGAPYMFISDPATIKEIGFPKIVQGSSESQTTWNSWSKGGSVNIEVGVMAGVKVGVVEAGGSAGISSSLAHKNSKKFSNTTTITTSVANAFLNEKLKQDWSVGSVYFSSSAAEYTGYCYLSPTNPQHKDPSQLTLKGLEHSPFTMITPYVAMKPKAKSISYNFHANNMKQRIDSWSSMDAGQTEAAKIGMLTAGIADFNTNNSQGSRLVVLEKNDKNTIPNIVKWQRETLNLDSFFEAGNDNKRIQEKTGKKDSDFTGVVKGVGNDTIDSNKWGLDYSITQNKTLSIEQVNTSSMQKEKDFSFGFNSACSVTAFGIGGYTNVSVAMQGGYASGAEGTKTKLFTLETVGGTKTGSAAIAVADVNVPLFKSWLGNKRKELKRPGWISEYAWENNSKFTAVIPFIWNGCLQSKR